MKIDFEADKEFLEKAIALSARGMRENEGGPFGCVVVKGGKIIAEGNNKVVCNNDPTAHAEVVAIRNACLQLNNYQLTGCSIYSSCEPCPMCLGAIYWARPERVFFANTRKDAADIEFDDDYIYQEINAAINERKIPFIHLPLPTAKLVFEEWKNKVEKKRY